MYSKDNVLENGLALLALKYSLEHTNSPTK